MLLLIGIVLVLVLGAFVLMPPKQTQSQQPAMLPFPPHLFGQQPTPIRPEASAWDKQVAADMLDRIALEDAQARVVETLRRAVAVPAPDTSTLASRKPIA